jgi:hypothetical protein
VCDTCGENTVAKNAAASMATPKMTRSTSKPTATRRRANTSFAQLDDAESASSHFIPPCAGGKVGIFHGVAGGAYSPEAPPQRCE